MEDPRRMEEITLEAQAATEMVETTLEVRAAMVRMEAMV